jgi:rhodanese-related sulfurtransferase
MIRPKHIAPASPDIALQHFEHKLAVETDCSDVHAALATGNPGFVLIDVRGAALFAAGHVPGAIHIPHAQLTEARLAAYPTDTLFVVYCAGPHCNGSTKAAARLARLGRPVKEMIGGVTGWIDDGLALARSDAHAMEPA